ncbi:GTP pyrophosphokinase [Sphingobacterium faecium]|uniref:GTP pyrophosphokinase n=1 Tax=Sphingobacterium faecium TaxID=34087 RepID=UPI003DA53561
MTNETITEKLTGLMPKYDSLGKSIVQAISLLLDKHNIKYVSIYYRVKSLNSFIDKIERKSYEKPLDEIEDICGVRVICYYQSDIPKIADIITSEFQIHTSEDKEDKLNADQFGYRSLHFIASIKKSWTNVPNYRELDGLKVEIQVRTILMHAWAEIEHNLAYKSEHHTPEQFKRKLYRISAKLEEADEQFEELKRESKAHQEELLKSAQNKTLKFTNETEINIDSLQAFLDFYFPKRKKSIENTASLLDDILKYNIKLGDIADAFEKLKPHMSEIEKETFEKNPNYLNWAQVGAVRLIMDIINDDYNKRNSKFRYKKRVEWREKYFA